MSDADGHPFRLLPRITAENEHFWTGGASGELRVLRCTACRYWVHPPAPVCPVCLGRSLVPEGVSGRAVVHTFTVNHHPWYPGFDPPYVIAIVELPEQAGLRLTTNVVGVETDEVHIGLPVRVAFEHHDDVYVPVFRPDGCATPS